MSATIEDIRIEARQLYRLLIAPMTDEEAKRIVNNDEGLLAELVNDYRVLACLSTGDFSQLEVEHDRVHEKREAFLREENRTIRCTGNEQ